jgi:hypothetical protein
VTTISGQARRLGILSAREAEAAWLALLRRLQRALGYKAAGTDATVEGVEVENVEADASAELETDSDQKLQPAAESPFAEATEKPNDTDIAVAFDEDGCGEEC